MKLPELKVKFICGLSNGENLIEDKGILERVEGEPSPWLKLQKYVKENDLKITSMSLQSKTDIGNRHYHLPSQHPRFQGEVPIGYNCFRWYAGDAVTGEGNIEHYTCAEAIFKDCKVQLWISEVDPDKCRVNFVKLDNEKSKS